ncbi:hypothetical protein HanRHA438_Chr10g0435971 [Helianthus annuus]|nr:hypothetical protein HanOQP8_Chr10g0352421 [Helianthus annuus]KAJ0878108.1 hypothetical protein HanRHA438_Chr10g0435971 [Helianthus annuus]KAJ0882397.1 hypothetical protein HanPSC8_Chr10g0409181 [Helianthus annuus]
MSTSAKPTTRKRKYKPSNPPGPDQAEINWREEEFQNLIQDLGFHSDWGVQFPTPKSTALDAPPGYLTLYADFFREGNFCLPMTKFTGEVLTNYGFHISQINALGLPRIAHFEFTCRANRVEPTFEKFNIFYFFSYTGGFYSFNSRTSGVDPCCSYPPKSLHYWKQKIFYIRHGVIPIDITIGPIVKVFHAPQNPRGFPIYGYHGKAGYSLMNVFDPKAGGAMVVAALPEGRPLWVEQIRNNFLHPTGECLATYANIVLGEDGEDDIDGETTEQVETRKKRKKDKTEEKKAEEPVAEAPRKRPSNSSFLDYVVVSDTLSGLDAGVKCSERDPDDDATLTRIMKKKKALEDKKKELDAQAAAALAEKKTKLQKETTAAPSESEIDLCMFSAKVGNRLEKMFKSASGSRAPKSGRSARKIDISKITPPTSPLSRPLDLSPPHSDPKGKGKEDEVEVDHTEKVVEGLLGEDTLEFEAAKKELAEEREKFNAEKKGLAWRVADAEDKLAKEKQFNANKQKEWETACERTNREMQTARDQIVKLKGEKTKMSDEHEQERALYQKRENEYIQRITKLEKIAAEKAAESEASEILAEEATADCKWLLARDIPLIVNRIVKSDELAKYMFELGEAAYDNGRKEGNSQGRAAAMANEKVDHFDLYKTDCAARYAEKCQEYEFLEFAIVKVVRK